MVKMNTIIKLFVVIIILALTGTMIFVLIETASGASIQTAGWRSSEYGYQSDPVYLIDMANQMAAKFPGSSPGGVYVVGEIYGAPGNYIDNVLIVPKAGRDLS